MISKTDYIIPPDVGVGHVHLKVSNLQRSLDFYCKVLGFEITTYYGTDAAFISAGGYHHHIGLNTWYSKDQSAPAPSNTGLFHLALLYPTRKDLARAYQQLLEYHYPLTGAADHGVSEALYLDDPDRNGIELYWDRPRQEWPKQSDGSLIMYTKPLDLNSLLGILD
jgi:catechol 2,3-dioxygenase